VPDHPHNVRRFLEGRVTAKSAEVQSDRDFWESLSRAEKLEVLQAVPEHVAKSSHRLYAAAREWMQVRDMGYRAVRGFQMRHARPLRARDDDWAGGGLV
jgi:hypothetical protein